MRMRATDRARQAPAWDELRLAVGAHARLLLRRVNAEQSAFTAGREQEGPSAHGRARVRPSVSLVVQGGRVVAPDRRARASAFVPEPGVWLGSHGISGECWLPHAAIVWQLDRRAGAPLWEAIELTSQSELVLRTLGEHMFNRYIEIKRWEWDDYRVQVSGWVIRAVPLFLGLCETLALQMGWQP